MNTSFSSKDPSTLSNYTKFDVTDGALDMDIDFDAKVVHGRITYQLVAREDTKSIVLDTSYLKIRRAAVGELEVDYKLHDRKEPLGSALELFYDFKQTARATVTIDYSTTDKCTALQFLDKEVTDGKKAPYLFSQCQAIHARSMVPCFDTPSVKLTYVLSATSPYKVLMSGRFIEKKGDKYFFEQPVPIPLYLLTIALGDIVGAPIGPRSTVYSEPVGIKAAQWEFEADMEHFLEIAEKLVFEYEWGTYDALVLPASFPYGGMENPNITFLTPTLICKDRLNVSVVAHELAHSWLGNLVTLKNWEHFWLNEGWTVYLERRIIEAITFADAKRKGKANPDQFAAQMRSFLAIIGWNDLENSVKAFGPELSQYTRLVLELGSADPDDSFLSVPYEKGSLLLVQIEEVLGGKKVFDPFIPHYFKKYRYKLVDTKDFLDTLYEFFADKKDKLDEIDWDTWLYGEGMPPKPKFDTTLADECFKLANEWKAATKSGDYDKFSQKDVESFEANQLVVLLDTLSSFENQNDFHWADYAKALEAMDKAYPIYSDTQNAEIKSRFYMLQVTGKSKKYCKLLGEWLGEVGRMKFVRPGYAILNEVDHDLAVKYFTKWENTYHPICRALVKKDLGLS